MGEAGQRGLAVAVMRNRSLRNRSPICDPERAGPCKCLRAVQKPFEGGTQKCSVFRDDFAAFGVVQKVKVSDSPTTRFRFGRLTLLGMRQRSPLRLHTAANQEWGSTFRTMRSQLVRRSGGGRRDSVLSVVTQSRVKKARPGILTHISLLKTSR
jgi:hypothetical protein